MGGTIVVGADASAPSRGAIDWALARSASLAMDVELVHVLDERRLGARSSDDFEIRERANDLLEAELERARMPGTVSGITLPAVTGRVVTGPLPQALRDAAADADLLVIGTHKTGFTYGRAFGSKFLPLASQSRCAVAVIPEFLGRSRRGVCVASADDGDAGLCAVEFASAEAARSGEKLILIPAADVMSESLVRASTTASLLVLAHPDDDSGFAIIHDVLANISSPVIVLGVTAKRGRTLADAVPPSGDRSNSGD